MKRHRPVGFVGLLLASAVLLGRGTLAADGLALRHPVLLGTALAGGVAAPVEVARLRRTDALSLAPDDAADALALVAAAALTYSLSVDAGLGPVVASAAVGLLAGVTLPRVDSAAYCGSFVGMVSPTVFDLDLVIAAGVIAAGLFVAARGAFDGLGGKLGTTALFGCLVVVVGTGAHPTAGSPPPWGEAVLIVPVAAVAAAATVALGVRIGLGAVVASAGVGLVAGLSFPAVLPGVGEQLAAAAFCASFVGMVAPARLDGERRVAAAGALSGTVFVAVSPVLGGVGGKLGTTAFVSCLAVVGAVEAAERLSGWGDRHRLSAGPPPRTVSERIEGEVIHAIPPEEVGEHDLEPELRSLAVGKHVLVCRRGGHPSVFELAWAMLRRRPIQPVTLVTDHAAAEGDAVDVTVEETSIAGVYREL
ncbi:MAG: DUF7526 family protein [Halolamina sp.]